MPANSDGRIRPEEIARVVVRPLGSVLPLGFLAFGTGIFVTARFVLNGAYERRLESEPGVRGRL